MDVILLSDVHMTCETITAVLVTRVKGHRGGPSLCQESRNVSVLVEKDPQCLSVSKASQAIQRSLAEVAPSVVMSLLSPSRPFGVCRVSAIHLYIYSVYRSRGIPGRFHPTGGKKRNENNYRINSLLF